MVADTAPSNTEFAEAVAKGYEPHDLKLRAVFMFIAGLSVTLLVVLSVIYAIMMALAAHDRSTDPLASPVSVKLPAVYAPLQPSLGFYGNNDNNHESLDSDDMLVMREKAQAALTSEGVGPTGRHYISIETAIDKALPELITRAVAPPVGETTYPPGSYEGHVGGTPLPEKPKHWHNDMNSLNNQGN